METIDEKTKPRIKVPCAFCKRKTDNFIAVPGVMSGGTTGWMPFCPQCIESGAEYFRD